MDRKNTYEKPTINIKEIKLNFFSTHLSVFDEIHNLDNIIAPNVFAQSGCFIQGTSITMADGSVKLIENVKKGDDVLSYDLTNNKVINNNVETQLTHYSHTGGYLIINNSLKVTGNHPLWKPEEKKWRHARTLTIGDKVTGEQGDTITINTIDNVDGTFDVYNLHLKKSPHNFFANGILAHNACWLRNGLWYCDDVTTCDPSNNCGGKF